MADSTVYGVLRRHGMSRLAHTDRASGAVVRCQREHPGELVHLDVKLGRIPDGGGHRVHGRVKGPRGRGIGYDYVHSAVDDRSRGRLQPDPPRRDRPDRGPVPGRAASFFADHSVTIQRVLTDNAKAYTQSTSFQETAAALGIRRKRTRPNRPQTNGKVERSTRPCSMSGPMGGCRSNAERCGAFTRWLRAYNHRRPHTSLDGLTPMAVLVNNLDGKHS
jgi:transposase InsO family protein